MNVGSPRLRGRTRCIDRGFTMIELIIAITLSLLIGGVVVAALVTSLNVAKATTEQVGDSADAGLIASFLLRDAQSAGGIDPSGLADVTLGVSTDPADPAGHTCRTDPSVVRFSWIERSSAVDTRFVVTYAKITDPQDATKQQLVRRVCTTGGATPATVDVVLGRNVLTAVAQCQPLPIPPALYCTGHPDSVTLTVAGKGTRLTSILTASLRSAASQLTIIGPPSLPDGQLNAAYPEISMSTIGAALPTSATKWSMTGQPAGITIGLSTGIISGSPTASGLFNVTITATDAASAMATKVYKNVRVQAPPVALADAYSINEDTTLTVVAPGVLGNDTNPNGTPITAVLYTGVANGALTFTSDGSFIYTPRSNFNGTDSFQYKAKDGAFASNIVTVTITVNAVNDAPVNRVPVAQHTAKNTDKVFTKSSVISISDVDAGGESVQVTLNATNGTVTLPGATNLTFLGGDGTADQTMTFTGTIADINRSLVAAIFTPNPDFAGAAALEIATSDRGQTGIPGPLGDTDSVAITVTGANGYGDFTDDQPVGNEKKQGSCVYQPGRYTIQAGQGRIEGTSDAFRFCSRAMTGDGSLTARVVDFRATGNGDAQAGVMFRETLDPASSHATMDLMDGNQAEFLYRPTAGGATSSSTSPGGRGIWVRLTRVGNVITAGRSDDNGATWIGTGQQTIAMSSTIYVGLAVSAHANNLSTATFENVSIGTPPTAITDSYSVNEDSTLFVDGGTGVLANDSDPEGRVLNAVLVAGTAGLALNPDGSLTYVPPPNFSGTASFTYMASNSMFNSTPVSVTITVNPANETPSFTKGADQTTDSNIGPQSILGWATAISPGVGEGDQLFDFILTNSNNSLFSVQPAVSADGTLTYASAAGATGVATVSISLHDNGGTAYGASDTSAVQTFTIMVADPPVLTATGTSLAYTENDPATVLDSGITATDADTVNLVSATIAMTNNYANGQDTLAFTNQPGIIGAWNAATGTLSLSGSSAVANYQAALRSVTYRNASDNPSTATRTVTFVVNDGLVNSNIASRTIALTAVNDAPVAVADSYSVNEDTTLTVPVLTGVLANDVDVEANLLTAKFASGTPVALNSNGSFTYVPPANFNGTASFTYRANDGSLDSNLVTVTLTVVPVNDAPTFTKGPDQSVAMNSAGATVAGWATSISQGIGEAGQVVNFVVTNSNNSRFSVQPAVSATGTLTYTPALNVAGVATVSVALHDDAGTANGGADTSAVQTFTITITDTIGPTGGAVSPTGLVGTGSRYSTSTTLNLALNKGSDPSGLAATGALLNRATAPLTSAGTADGACGAFVGYTLVTTDPPSSKSDTVPASGCYRYQYVVKDTLGNSTTYTSPDIKVDNSVPAAPSLVFSAFTKAYWSGSGTVVYYNSTTATAGAFTVTATATDTTSGILSYTFPALSTGTSTPGTLGVNTYSWSAAPAAGPKSVTATNNATSTSATSFTLTGDLTIPTGGAVSYLNGSQTSTTITVTFGSSTDAGSGIATRLLQRSSATLTGTTCGSYSPFATVVNGTNPAGTALTDTVAHGSCYKYQYVVTDNVGNVDTNTSPSVTKNS